jgi:hypothetical protein
VRRVTRKDIATPWYLNAAMGLLGIGGFFMVVGALQALATKGQLATTAGKVGAAISLVVGIAAIVAAGGMNAGRAWGWLVGVIVSSLIVVAGIVAIASPSRGLGAVLTLLIGILLVVAFLLPGSRVLMRPMPPRPDEADGS